MISSLESARPHHWEALRRDLRAGDWVAPVSDEADVLPGGELSFVFRRGGEIAVATGRWGLVTRETLRAGLPAALRARTALIRDDELGKLQVRSAWQGAQQCLVPVAALQVPDHRNPDGDPWSTRISRRDEGPLYLAGLWSSWADENGVRRLSVGLLTVDATGHPLMGNYGPPGKPRRMPVILPRGLGRAWLLAQGEERAAFLRPLPAAQLSAVCVEKGGDALPAATTPEVVWPPAPSTEVRRQSLLLVDDEPSNLQLLRLSLQADYHLIFATEGGRAIELARERRPDLILLDLMMPGVDGYAVCEALKADPGTAHIPIVFCTAVHDGDAEAKALRLGAADYITKPFYPHVVAARVRTHMATLGMLAAQQSSLRQLQRLCDAAAMRANVSTSHIQRMSQTAHEIALEAGARADWCAMLQSSAPLHDLGIVAVPDAVLRKPGPLDPDEWTVMRAHPLLGAQLIGDDPSDVLGMARDIALCHHERWDGTGYPSGLAGEQIPLAARIVAIADTFDAMTSSRPYRRAMSEEEAAAHIRAGAGAAFEPRLVEAFSRALPRILRMRQRWVYEVEGAYRDEIAAPATLEAADAQDRR